jgi:hypothetical protein
MVIKYLLLPFGLFLYSSIHATLPLTVLQSLDRIPHTLGPCSVSGCFCTCFLGSSRRSLLPGAPKAGRDTLARALAECRAGTRAPAVVGAPSTGPPDGGGNGGAVSSQSARSMDHYCVLLVYTVPSGLSDLEPHTSCSTLDPREMCHALPHLVSQVELLRSSIEEVGLP